MVIFTCDDGAAQFYDQATCELQLTAIGERGLLLFAKCAAFFVGRLCDFALLVRQKKNKTNGVQDEQEWSALEIRPFFYYMSYGVFVCVACRIVFGKGLWFRNRNMFTCCFDGTAHSGHTAR